MNKCTIEYTGKRNKIVIGLRRETIRLSKGNPRPCTEALAQRFKDNKEFKVTFPTKKTTKKVEVRDNGRN